MAAIDEIGGRGDSGQIRDFTGNAYTGRLAKGDIVAAGWSGDAIQLRPTTRHRVAAARRGMQPLVRQHGDPCRRAEPDRGRAFMDYVYDPEVQATSPSTSTT